MSIQVRVIAAAAMRQLAQVQRQLAALRTENEAAAASAGLIAARGVPALAKWGSQIQWAGRQLQYNFTLPLAAAAIAATKFALDNEKAMVRVKKVYGDASMSTRQMTSETNALQKAFVALSNEFGVNQAEVINIAADWAAAGASGVALAKSTKLTLETMVLGEMDAATATKALISIQAQYGLSTNQLSKTIDTLNMVENQTGTSLADLIEVMSKSAGTARSAGVDIRHLAALTAALVPAAGSAANAGNGLKTILSRLIAPTKQASDLLGEMGINTKSASWEALNGVGRLEAMAKAFQGLSGAQKVVVETTAAGRYQLNRFDVLMRDITNTNGYYQKALRATQSEQGNFNQKQRELNAVLASQPQQFKQLWVILQNGMAQAIGPLIPLFIALFAAITKAVTSFTMLDPSLQKLILFGLAFIAAVGPVLKLIGSLATLLGFLGRAIWLIIDAVAAVIGVLGGWVAALVAIVAALIIFHDKLGAIWDNIVKTALNAFYALPKGVQDAMEAVVRIVDKAAHEVYDLFSYLNPFAHHSPSLVESVQRGMALIMNEYAKAGKIGQPFAEAARNLGLYKKAVASQQGVVDKLSAQIKVANTLLTQQQKVLQDLQTGLQTLQSAYDAAQSNMQNFASAPIKGMQAFSDKIFDNQQAQKKLQLQMLQWQATYGSIDDLNSKLSEMNGEITSLQGEASNLRAKGAGNDVLGPLNDQITALQKAASATQKTIDNSPIADLQKQMDKLDQAGQILQLQNDIKFDPLERQIDKLANTTKELSYDQIIKGIKDSKKEMNDLQPKITAQTDAIAKQQKVVDDLTNARDFLQAIYDKENDTLSKLTDSYNKLKTAIDGATKAKKGAGISDFAAAKAGSYADPGGFAKIGREGKAGDQSKDIDKFTAGIQKELSDRLGKLDMFKPLKDAWKKVQGFLSGTVGKGIGDLWAAIAPTLTKIGDGISHAFAALAHNKTFQSFVSGIKDAFGLIGDILKTVFQLIGGFVKLVAPVVKDVVQKIVGFFKDLWKRVAPEIGKFGKLLKPFIKLLSEIWYVIQSLLIPVVLAAAATFKIAAPIIKRVLGPLLDFIVSTIKNIIKVLRGVIEFVLGVLTFKWKLAWQGIKDIFGGLWDEIWSLAKNGIKVLVGIFSGAIKGLTDIGKDIIKGLWDGIKAGWDVLMKVFKDAWKNLVDTFKNFLGIHSPSTLFAKIGKDIITGLWNGIKAAWKTISDWFKGLGSWFKGIFLHASTWLLNAGKAVINGIWSGIKTAWQTVKTFFGGIGTTIKNWFNNAKNWLVTAGGHIIGGIWSGIKTAWETVKTFFSGLGGKLAGYFTNAKNWLVDGGKRVLSGLWSGIKKSFNDIVSWFKDLPGKILHALGIHSPPKWAIEAGKWIIHGLHKGLTGSAGAIKHFFGNMISEFTSGMAQKIYGKGAGKGLGGLISGIGDAGDIGSQIGSNIGGGKIGAVGGGLEYWAQMAAMYTNTPQSWVPALMRRAMFESGGNPKAINLYDINAQEGHPSKGLMQTIDSTFSNYAMPGHGDIWNPIDNMIAAIRYIKAVYGNISSIDPPVQGYAKGAWKLDADQVAKVHRGEMIVPATYAESIRNALASKKAQTSLTNGVKAAPVQQGGGNQPTQLHVTIQNAAFPNITSADDAEAFFANLEIVARSAT